MAAGSGHLNVHYGFYWIGRTPAGAYHPHAMRFLKRHQFFLALVAVLIFCSVMVIRQYLVNQWKHVDLREDFILLHDQGQTQGAERLYQMLIQQLPQLPAHDLIADEQRLAPLVASKPSEEDLIWKYYVSVQNELQRRTDQRVARALKRAGIK